MNLFSRENDLIKRILNLILIVWLLITIVVFYSNTVDILFDYKLENYDDYKVLYCEEMDDDECLDRYDSEKVSNKISKHDKSKILINSGGNFIVVGAFLFLFNKGNK